MAPSVRSQVAVGTSPFGVAVGDFNSDGFADLAVTNLDDNTVSILLGDGHGTFTQATGSPIAVGNVPRSVSVGDFNGDGIADLAVTDSNDNKVRILLGNGIGSFTQAPWSPVAVGGRPYGVSVGDFNGDGIADLAVANLVSDTVNILLNQVTQTATAMLTGVNIPGSATHEVYATYPETESTIFDGSTSPTIPLTATPVATTLALTASTDDKHLRAAGSSDRDAELRRPFGLHYVGRADGDLLQRGASLGTGTVTSGVATLNVTSLPAGTDSLTASYAGDTNFVASTSPADAFVVSKVTPVITWANPAAITYGTALSGTQLNATASVPGTFAYSPAAGAVLNAGTQTLNVTFTPTDTTNYATATASVSLVVNKAILTVTANERQPYLWSGKSCLHQHDYGLREWRHADVGGYGSTKSDYDGNDGLPCREHIRSPRRWGRWLRPTTPSRSSTPR